jgi:hypothetical protein
MMVGGAAASIALPFKQCVVPDGINGPVAIYITSDGQPLVNNVRDRAKDKLIAGPTMAVIDSQSETLGQLARTGNANSANSTSNSNVASTNSTSSASGASNSTGGATTVATQTISPEEASSVIASASATQSSSGTQAAASGAANAAASPGGPNTMTGPSADGSVNVNGWTQG